MHLYRSMKVLSSLHKAKVLHPRAVQEPNTFTRCGLPAGCKLRLLMLSTLLHKRFSFGSSSLSVSCLLDAHGNLPLLRKVICTATPAARLFAMILREIWRCLPQLEGLRLPLHIGEVLCSH